MATQQSQNPIIVLILLSEGRFRKNSNDNSSMLRTEQRVTVLRTGGLSLGVSSPPLPCCLCLGDEEIGFLAPVAPSLPASTVLGSTKHQASYSNSETTSP